MSKDNEMKDFEEFHDWSKMMEVEEHTMDSIFGHLQQLESGKDRVQTSPEENKEKHFSSTSDQPSPPEEVRQIGDVQEIIPPPPLSPLVIFDEQFQHMVLPPSPPQVGIYNPETQMALPPPPELVITDRGFQQIASLSPPPPPPVAIIDQDNQEMSRPPPPVAILDQDNQEMSPPPSPPQVVILNKGSQEMAPPPTPQVVTLSQQIQQMASSPPQPTTTTQVLTLNEGTLEMAPLPPSTQIGKLNRNTQEMALLPPPTQVVIDEETQKMAPPSRVVSVPAQVDEDLKPRRARGRPKEKPPQEPSLSRRGRGRPHSRDERPPWLPVMWKVSSRTRKKGASAGQRDKYYFSPDGRRCRSKNEVMQYVATLATTQKDQEVEASRDEQDTTKVS